ncbi:hypothetical protein [Halorubrum sp. AJ67]|uniref:hypothetical protein n=1 Tax=Halorubrum sp. AJ67 TaxID=1173487 RepID=UPI00064F8AA4|nr:hypothetical protein [Halorubrum sp. AJ67]
MDAYAVSYDLNEPEQEYTELIDALESYEAHWHELTSFWLLDTDESHTEIRDNLKQYIDSNDEILVLGLSGSAAASSINDWDWIEEHV